MFWERKELNLLNCVPYVLTCQRALRVLRAHMPMCLGCLCAHMPTCLACSCAHVPTCLVCLRANVSCVSICWRDYVLMPCVSRVNMSCVPTCSRAITTNDKYKFSTTCFPCFSIVFLWLFFAYFLWNKTAVHSCISPSSQKPLTGAITNFVQWNGLNFVRVKKVRNRLWCIAAKELYAIYYIKNFLNI